MQWLLLRHHPGQRAPQTVDTILISLTQMWITTHSCLTDEISVLSSIASEYWHLWYHEWSLHRATAWVISAVHLVAFEVSVSQGRFHEFTAMIHSTDWCVGATYVAIFSIFFFNRTYRRTYRRKIVIFCVWMLNSIRMASPCCISYLQKRQNALLLSSTWARIRCSVVHSLSHTLHCISFHISPTSPRSSSPPLFLSLSLSVLSRPLCVWALASKPGCGRGIGQTIAGSRFCHV